MTSTIKLQKTDRRDTLVAIEKNYQAYWQENRFFEVDAPLYAEDPEQDGCKLRESHPKYFATMAYPYMNGVLHAGHAFTFSKTEFATGFERMNGKRALFPLGFHCTGMPIKASADKIQREIEMFGPEFAGAPADDAEEEHPEVKQEKADVTKFTAKKSKVAAKQGRGKYQFEIMMQLGLQREEVAAFADPQHWLNYFPHLVRRDVNAFGGRVDWRRSMVTTPANSYYDAFVRWQINRLKEVGKIKFGERYTIYSEKDGQACLDHDRRSGEGVNPQEYVGIKIEVTQFAAAAQKVFAGHGFDLAANKVYLVAATLRPETMYGQTCCFVSPKITYGVFKAAEGVYYITTKRAFKNMSFQKLTPARGDYAFALEISGAAIVGSHIRAPLALLSNLRVIPMDTILANKGTGVVTCVPSDSPADYVTTRDLANKPEYYQIEKEWVQTEVVPIVQTTKYGDKCAEHLVNELKIQSPKDVVQLAQAKELAYKEGYYNGTMLVGKYKGESVESAKPKVKADMMAEGTAFVYKEPENLVMSRSGDECVVSLENQWYIDYGEQSWKNQALECLASMETYGKETRHGFEAVLDWLKNWALTRTYGLGTKCPWDESQLIESLSDSTVYMAYYTIARFLHSDYYGQTPGKFDIKPGQMTDEVFDYIFTGREGVQTDIPSEQLNEIKREFEYFYPVDVRVSGKDLIPNHLTFFIYTHVALFPKKCWPQGVRANGHLMLNNAKMSKSTGNFLTLQQIVEKFGADAARIAIADAGDTVEDANFDEASANAAILRLTTLKEWCEEIKAGKDSLRTGDYTSFFDRAFENEMNYLVEQAYEQYSVTNYKTALKAGLFDFQSARDYYRDSVACMHKDLVFKYIELQALLLAPIAPHFAEYLYREILEKDGSVQNARFPRASQPVSQDLLDSLVYVKELCRAVRDAESAVLKSKKGKAEVDASKPAAVTLLVSKSFPEWQEQCIELVRELFEALSLNDTKTIKERVGKGMKRAMPFINFLKQRLAKEDPKIVFNRQLTFSEAELLPQVVDIVQRSTTTIKVEKVNVITFPYGSKTGTDVASGAEVKIPATDKVVEAAVPGEPGIVIRNI
ncbi:leucyl-tRNA synthetase [Metschnikowia bicuspidata]|uniref:leucine--tRNA ligase n=1 Tax=Metschnikowia bicuspidata TaxID=27322 RepID=A0A4V1J3N8_9ASCO|nr:leucyl-tRNA synthetase [Metschnikowia bicuspidata]